MNVKTKMPIGIGICSLVMMFIALTMASIMSLTLMTSYREARLTQKSIEATKAYYQAEAKANAIFLEIGETYDIYYTSASRRHDLFEGALAEMVNVTKIEQEEVSRIYYEVPISEKQVIEVIVEIELQEDPQIVSWKVKNSNLWTYEEETFGTSKIS